MKQFFLSPRYNFLTRFYKLAFVNVISNMMVPLAGLISVIFLGHLQEIYHLAGVALSVVLFNYLYFLFNFLRMGSTGPTARSVGENDREGILKVGLQNGLVALSFGIAILCLQYPIRELWFALVHAPPEVKASGNG
ncbi:MAG: MATE family efflux transporter [Cyanobacteria bacterium P01_E01_bin.42]